MPQLIVIKFRADAQLPVLINEVRFMAGVCSMTDAKGHSRVGEGGVDAQTPVSNLGE